MEEAEGMGASKKSIEKATREKSEATNNISHMLSFHIFYPVSDAFGIWCNPAVGMCCCDEQPIQLVETILL